jgi:hypothetical protein
MRHAYTSVRKAPASHVLGNEVTEIARLRDRKIV